MNKRRNYRILWWTLILGSLVLDLIRGRMEPGAAREIVRYIGVVMLAVAVVQLVVVRAKPKVLKDGEQQ
ncbi:hypothetical protein Q4E93_21670 [Flavitalea sp. BT771]|uniref:hypothetical protein n=1 Tax=Flavitalea sp. BT771 TaxID=3063329 RepID=UPI0026E376A2|nr:hypothetical protein [Flavitalea sp. BT771]MDO6433234.1 hypothetical protein [Flavitalea sp. BT771]MDV6221490.1 hypothetical protein [Flavitalea sp. BT771]